MKDLHNEQFKKMEVEGEMNPILSTYDSEYFHPVILSTCERKQCTKISISPNKKLDP